MPDRQRQEDLRSAGGDQAGGEERPELADVESVRCRRRCRGGGGGDGAEGDGDECPELGLGGETETPPYGDGEGAEGRAGEGRKNDGVQLRSSLVVALKLFYAR